MTIDVATFKRHAELTDDPEDSGIQAQLDADVQRVLDAAVQVAETLLDRRITPVPDVYARTGWPPDGWFYLDTPASAVVSIQYRDEADALQTLAANSYELVASAEAVHVFSDVTLPTLGTKYYDKVILTVTSGDLPELPASVEQWIFMFAKTLFDNPATSGDEVLQEFRFSRGLLVGSKRVGL